MKENKMDLIKVFGTSAKVKVLVFFLKNTEPTFAYEIKKKTRSSFSNLRNFILPDLLKQKIIVLDRKIGSNKFYKTNMKSPIVKKLIGLMEGRNDR